MPVVLVHGLGVSADYWVRNAPVIAADGFRVLAPDLPGFGGTKGPLAGLDVAQQINALMATDDGSYDGPPTEAAYIESVTIEPSS